MRDLGADNNPPETGISIAKAINNAGQIVGSSLHCFSAGNCQGVFPARGNPLTLAVAENLLTSGSAGNSIEKINAAGDAVGFFPVAGGDGLGALFQGGTLVSLGFNPRAILNDGTVVGDGYRTGGVRIRSPGGGPLRTINCGLLVADANDAGDILTFDISSDGFRIWHQVTCYKLSSLLPEGVSGYTFPSTGGSFTRASINELGQISTAANKFGLPKQISVLLTPRYPFAIEITSKPTGTPGEFEFEAVATRGTSSGTVTWDFGDGSAPVVTGKKITKKFTKPGTFTIKAKTADVSNSNVTSNATFTVTVSAPTLVTGIVVPEFQNVDIPLGRTFKVDVNVGALNDGVGDLSDLSFQGGTFTVSTAGILDFTTASTSPFTLSPGAANSYPLNVRAAGAGKVTLNMLVIGKDANGNSVSATSSSTISVAQKGATSKDISVKVGSITKASRAPVTLTNNASSAVSGRFRFIKPLRTSARLQQFMVRQLGVASGSAVKITSYSNWILFSLAAGESKAISVKPSKNALTILRPGKSLKASLVLEVTGVAAADATRTVSVVLKRPRGRS